jgi:hypothetical protein
MHPVKEVRDECDVVPLAYGNDTRQLYRYAFPHTTTTASGGNLLPWTVREATAREGSLCLIL